MAVNFSIKNVPDAMAAKLRERAERNHRSLQGELMAILESASLEAGRSIDATSRRTRDEAHERAAPTRKLSIEEVAAESRKLFPRGTPSSTEFIREMRDGRYGEGWAKTGQHTEPR